MGMKHILRALDQALETAEVERKYLLDELEAERVEKQRLAAELEQSRAEIAAARQEALWELRREKERMQGAVDSLESENAKLREALEKWKN